MPDSKEDKVEKEKFCPLREYEKLYDSTEIMDCYWCSVQMRDCEYWKARLKDKEVIRDDYTRYLLGRLK